MPLINFFSLKYICIVSHGMKSINTHVFFSYITKIIFDAYFMSYLVKSYTHSFQFSQSEQASIATT